MRTSLSKAQEITDARIQFVSLVDKAANKRNFLLKKADGGKATWTTYGRIIKADADSHYVTGIVYEPMAEDSHGNFMTEAEITKAAYWFAKNGDKVDIQHSFEPFEGATIVENWIAKADFDIDGEAVTKGTWLLTVEVTDPDVWAAIEKGEITGFSMGGIGNYSEEDVDLDTVSKQEAPAGRRGLLKQMAEALGFKAVEKGAMTELYEERSKGTLFWNAFQSLEDILYRYDPITGRYLYETDEAKVRECLGEFSTIITDVLAGGESITKAVFSTRPVEKAGKKMSGKNRETLSGIYDSLGAFLKEFEEPEDDKTKKPGEEPDDTTTKKKEDDKVEKQDIQQIAEAVVKAMSAKPEGQGTPEGTPGAAPVTKAAPEGTAPAAITPEAIEKMVEAAIEKAMKPQQEQAPVTAEQVGSMIEAAVAKAMEPVLKAKGLPSNLGSATVEKGAGEEPHYLHGIL